MNISTIGYWIVESLEGIKKNSKTFLIGLGTMFVVLSLIGALYILYMNANSFMGDIKDDQSKVNLYVQGLTEDEVTVIWSELRLIDGVSEVDYIDQKQAYEIAKDMDPDMVEGIDPDEGIFKASFVLTIEGTDNGDITPIKNAVYGMSRLYEAITNTDGFEEAEKSVKIAKSVKVITITILILVTVMGCFIMMNSIKLALYARRKEISIMKYVGATDTFTRAPFIIEGLIIAVLAAGITLIATNFIYGGLMNILGDMQLFDFMVDKKDILGSVSILLLVVSIAIGTIGSSMSISKYLDV